MPAIPDTAAAGQSGAGSQRKDQHFYPSAVVRLAVRLEETFQPEIQGMPQAQSVDDAVWAATTQALSPSGSTMPDAMSGQHDALTMVLDRVPKHMSVELPGYRQAGKFSMTFDWRDLPLDPRQIRAVGVEVHLGAVRPLDFARGVSGTLPDGVGRSSVIPARDQAGQPDPSTLLFMGSADVVRDHHTKTSSEFSIEGRDLRGILLDSPIRPDQLAKLDLSRPIDQVVRQIIGFHPFAGRFDVRPNSRYGSYAYANDRYMAEWPGNVPIAPGVQGDVTRVRLGAAPPPGGNPAGVGVQMSAPGAPDKCNMWDMITRYCFLCGAVPYFVGQVLWIRRARNLFDTLAKDPTTVIDPDKDQPFRSPRSWTTDATTEQLKVRRLVYGQDILDLQMERKIGGVTLPVVELVCVNTSSKQRGMGVNPTTGRSAPNKLLISQYPPPPPPQGSPSASSNRKRSTKVAPGGGQASTDILRIPVHGISSQKRLDDMARDVFEEIAHQEFAGRFTTKDLSSLGGGNTDPDLLRLRPGDPIQILVRSDVAMAASPVESELIRAGRMKQATLAKAFSDRTGADAKAGDAVARTAKGLSAVPASQNVFRVSNVKFSWSASDGIGIDCEFQNYVTAVIAGASDGSAIPAAASGPSKSGATVGRLPTNQPSTVPGAATSSQGER